MREGEMVLLSLNEGMTLIIEEEGLSLSLRGSRKGRSGVNCA